ncbi:hypothetical protein DelCs14_2673 [Delftia sp. Cs1-4]|uniref:hypothetical protein n=1 Tax=Delftia sp. (strain Cs1-4) TaxID=742013 RepID=UPI00020E827F|nr:hypothetical protein [Delftia sp. Cs1-4]AEF89685.1 hypothetical protein DelCs14_2673 [Delftia sp. Cs1-4]
MRDYSKVGPQFWTGKTGKEIRKKGTEATLVALYLMTSPHSNMLGLYFQPLMYMAYETGLGIEGASKGLQDCTDVGFCSYDDESEMVWVHEMAAFQIADELKESDKRTAGVQKDYDTLQDNPFLAAFFDRYQSAFHLKNKRGIEAPSKPHRSQEQEQEQEQEKKEPYGSVGSADDQPGEIAPGKPGLPNCPVQDLVDLYHEVLPELPKVRLLNDGRRKAVGKLWKFVLTSKKSDGTSRAETADQAVTWFREYFGRARDNDFLMGRGFRSPEHAGWQCDLDFLLTDKGMKHVIEKTRTTA